MEAMPLPEEVASLAATIARPNLLELDAAALSSYDIAIERDEVEEWREGWFENADEILDDALARAKRKFGDEFAAFHEHEFSVPAPLHQEEGDECDCPYCKSRQSGGHPPYESSRWRRMHEEKW